jgi:hypothetical protein
MTNKELRDKLRKLDKLYAEHAINQDKEDHQERNKLRLALHDLFLVLKPYIKKQTRLQWYEPTYNYAITGNLDYIESARNDLESIIQNVDSGPAES